MATEIGAQAAAGSGANIALMPGIVDSLWLRAFHGVVPSLIAQFKPQIIVQPVRADSHAADPLTDLALSVEGQRAAILAMRDLADKYCEGRWLAVGAVVTAWSTSCPDLDPLDRRGARARPRSRRIPDEWMASARDLAGTVGPAYAADPVGFMGDGGTTSSTLGRRRRCGGTAAGIGRTGLPADRPDHSATRRAVFPLHGLDPEDPVTEPPSTSVTDAADQPDKTESHRHRCGVPRPCRVVPGGVPARVGRGRAGLRRRCVHIRPIVPDDADDVVEFHSRLSERTRYMRGTSGRRRRPPREVARMTTVDYHDRVALVALLGGKIIAIGVYEASPTR